MQFKERKDGTFTIKGLNHKELQVIYKLIGAMGTDEISKTSGIKMKDLVIKGNPDFDDVPYTIYSTLYEQGCNKIFGGKA